MTVAALYLLERSSGYRDLPGVDLWPKTRDATTYPGTHPIVAHPPCGPWSAHWAHASKRDDPRLAVIAVGQVRRWGGILEHPAHSRLWAEMDLPAARPLAEPGLLDSPLEYSIEVEQGWWGHLSRKPTWLYLVGIPRGLVVLPSPKDPPPPRRIAYGRSGAGRPFIREAVDMLSSETRKRTPAAFAEWLADLAAQSQGPRS